MNNYTFNFLNNTYTIDISWKKVFDELKPELLKIEKAITNDSISSNKSDIFKIFEKPLNNISIIILGQDPYPQRNIPTGRAFEVSNLKNWNDLKNNISLINIIKGIYFERNRQNKNIYFIKNEIENNKFEIRKPNVFFTNLENNGVFLMNTSLTCKIDKSNSHSQFWSCFTKRIIEEIADNRNKKEWLLWGNEAKKYSSIVELYSPSNNIIYGFPHPRNHSFIKSNATKSIEKFV